MSAADTALVALADHCFSCTAAACRPDVDQPKAEKSACPEAERLYRDWRDACREGAL